MNRIGDIGIVHNEGRYFEKSIALILSGPEPKDVWICKMLDAMPFAKIIVGEEHAIAKDNFTTVCGHCYKVDCLTLEQPART